MGLGWTPHEPPMNRGSNRGRVRCMPLRELVTRLRAVVEGPEWKEAEHPRADAGKFASSGGSNLSSDEKKYLTLMAKRTSDKKMRIAMNMTHDQAFQFAVALRAKLGLPDGGSLRDAGRAMGLK